MKSERYTYAWRGAGYLMLMLFLLPVFSFAQNPSPVKGRVTAAGSGLALPGVSVKIDGSGRGATTDTSGRFSIAAKPGETLVFSYIGFERLSFVLKDQSNLNILLKESSRGIDEVVVIGYGAVAKKDLTGSVGSVNMEDLSKAPVLSFDEALAGRLAGVQVSSGEGQPGSQMNIVIRGANSLTQSNAPLYVIDGFPMEDPESASINPDDIASIDVLKDASATAIYGARGANGVIVITTKKGKPGKPVVTYSGSYGIQKVLKTIPMMNPYEFVKYQYDRNPDVATESYLQNGKTLESYKNEPGYNWQDYIFRTAPITNHNLSLRGGNAQTQYSLSGSVSNQEGIIIQSGFKRYQGRISIDQVVTPKVKTGVTINYSNTTQTGASPSANNNQSTNYLLFSVWGYRPVSGAGIDLSEDLFDPDINDAADHRINPVISTQNELRLRGIKNFTANAYVDYNITKDLLLKITGGVNSQTGRSDAFFNSMTHKGTPLFPTNVQGINGSVSYDELSTWVNENTLSYRKTFNKVHKLDVVAGMTMQAGKRSRYGFAAQQVPNEELELSGLDEGIPYQAYASDGNYTLASFLGRVNYGFRSKYLFTASLRADGSSKFAPENQWSYFPSAAFAWRMSGENFMKGLRTVSDAKLRISYGVTGNNRVGDFDYMPSLQLPIGASYSFNNATPSKGVIPGTIGNRDLKWESTEQIDIGYDLGLFNNRIEFSADVYRKTTRDLLLQANVPYTTGFETVFKNIGSVRNQGLELTLSTVNIDRKNFTWSSNFNISFNQTKVLALAEGEEALLTPMTWDSGYKGALYIARLRQSTSLFYGYIWDGLYKYEDFIETAPGQYVLRKDVPANTDTRDMIKPGHNKFRDINGDGVANTSDMTVIGRGLPIHTGGFSNNFSYKGLSLNVFFQWSYGNDIMNANRLMFEENVGNRNNLNQYKSYVNRWSPENPDSDIPVSRGQTMYGLYSSRVIEDGSYLRLKTLSLQYSLPKRWLKPAKISSIGLSVAAQNLWTWTSYSGMDPEVSVRHSALSSGFDYSAYPRARTLTFGVKASF
ncbi:SusC/RagA family TonB-linked outer membrane protein [Chitinophaga sp. GCM10012297]|uniref:TonB-dependent receptor n=1 Tax=Chitinophaga chungangae TaxID=2821488 RepID=A0ABS3YHJ2_9BACT|nr:TonB-dependent receptor [Chitinophaga chungangae]MBO9154156.1 TonB-dependent receptor [Chitinophaga chungangae]